MHFLYTNIPYHYVYDKKETKWKSHKKGGDKIISRLCTVSIKDIERFYLRLLLPHVAGAKHFEDLRTVMEFFMKRLRMQQLQKIW